MTLLPEKKTKPGAEQLTYLIYGPNKIGKSELASKFPEPLFLITEPGLNFIEAFKVEIDSWDTFLDVCGELTTDTRFKTLVFDVADDLALYCMYYVCEKFGMDHPSDEGYGKGWSFVKNEFTRVMKKLSLQGRGLVFISHATEREIETRTKKYTRTMASLGSGSRNIIYGLVDIIAYIGYNPENPAERKIYLRGSSNIDCGSRAKQIPEVIDFGYEALMAAVKEKAEK